MSDCCSPNSIIEKVSTMVSPCCNLCWIACGQSEGRTGTFHKCRRRHCHHYWTIKSPRGPDHIPLQTSSEEDAKSCMCELWQRIPMFNLSGDHGPVWDRLKKEKDERIWRTKTKQTSEIALEKLIQRTGMPVTISCGQRRYGPPRNFTGPPPPTGSEVFVARLPRDALEPEIVPIFEKYGRIYQIRLTMHWSGQMNQGFGFVQYYSVKEADKAILKLQNHEIRPGKLLGVAKSRDNCFLHIEGIRTEMTSEDILKAVCKVVETAVRAHVYPSKQDPSKNVGIAIVEFKNHTDAAEARRALAARKTIWGSPIDVDWARREPGLEIPPSFQIEAVDMEYVWRDKPYPDVQNRRSGVGVVGVGGMKNPQPPLPIGYRRKLLNKPPPGFPGGRTNNPWEKLCTQHHQPQPNPPPVFQQLLQPGAWIKPQQRIPWIWAYDG